MAALAELRDKMQKAHARAKSIVEANPKGLTADQDLEVETLIKAAREAQGEIKQAEALETKTRDLENLSDYLDRPERTLPHGVNGDSDDRKALLGSGWEIKAGHIYAQTSLMQNGNPVLVPMFPEEVLFGDIPTDDKDQAVYFQKTRALFSKPYRGAYVKHFRVLAATKSESQAWNALTGEEQKALSEGSDTAGGFLVPPDAQAEMLARVAARSVIRMRARIQPTSRDILQWPAVAPSTNSTNASIFSSGFVGGWVGETPVFTETDPSFQSFSIPIKKLRIATKLSNDLINDAQVNILAFLAQNGSENMALVEDLGFIAGDGSPLQPRGILNTGATTVSVEGATTNTVDNSTTNAGSAPKLIDLSYALPAQYTNGASWLMRRAIEGKVRKLVDGSGRYMWPPFTGGAFAAVQRELLGYPIDNSDFMPTDGIDGNKVMVFGDIGQYIIAQRAAISSRVLNERFADTDQVGIILFERVGGDLWNTDAIRIGVV